VDGRARAESVDKCNVRGEQGSSACVEEQIDDGTVLANAEGERDQCTQLREKGDRLDGNAALTEAMDGLPSDSIARAFVKGSAIQSAIDRSLEQEGLPSGTTADQLGKLDSFGAAVTPGSNGIRIDSALSGDLKLGGSGYHADLASSLPSGATVYYSFNNLGGRLNTFLDDYARTHPSFDQQRAQAETALGMTFDDVFNQLSGEGAFALYRTASGPPAVIFAVQVSDETKARQLVDKAAALAQLGNSAQVRTVQVGGLQAREFDVSGSTIELSSDAPMRAPFEVYVQGGVNAAHAYLGALLAARALL